MNRNSEIKSRPKTFEPEPLHIPARRPFESYDSNEPQDEAQVDDKPAGGFVVVIDIS